MVSLLALLGFGLAVLPMVLTPGASFALVSARSLAGDHAGAWATIAGTAAGILVHGVLAGVGLALVVMRSAELYAALRLAGAAYLVALGVWFLIRGRVSGARRAPEPERGEEGRPGWLRSFATAATANVLNVKAASVYLTVAPAVLPAEQATVTGMLCLGLVHVAVMATWLGLWASGVRGVLRRVDPRAWQRRIEQVGGCVLVVLGVRTAVAR